MAEGNRAVAVCEHRAVVAESELVCERCGEVLGHMVTVNHTGGNGESFTEIVDEELITYEEHELVSRKQVVERTPSTAPWSSVGFRERRRRTRDYKLESERWGNAWAKSHRDSCNEANRRWRAKMKLEREAAKPRDEAVVKVGS
jgi:hypothetical protein